MTSLMVNENLTGEDAEFGYEFGCDGLMNAGEVESFLSCSRDTVDRMVVRRQLRKRKDRITGKVKYCRRSVTEYVRGMGD